MNASDTLARRKALLIARADLERMNCVLAWYQLRSAMAPSSTPERLAWARPKVRLLLKFALPLLGADGVGRVVRALSVGVMVYRVVRGWREVR